VVSWLIICKLESEQVQLWMKS